MSANLVNLLDKITEGRELPEGCTHWAIRSVHPDLTSSRGYQWSYPGQTATAPGPIDSGNSDGCPSNVGDGICAATTWAGMASGSIPAITLLLVAYNDADVLGRTESEGKFRASSMRVVELLDGAKLLREHGTRADLAGANLTRANFTRAYLAGANLTRANLTRTDLTRAYLTGADLAGANLARANLARAYLAGAYLTRTDLTRANLTGANLTRTDLTGAIRPEGFPS